MISDIELVVSELVSNAVAHGTPPYDVEMSDINGVIRGGIRDTSTVAPRVNRQPDQRGGFGLTIVANRTSRWGTTATAYGKEVWFEIDS